MQAEDVPEHDAAVRDRAAFGHHVGEAAGAGRAVHEVAARIALLGVVGRDPEVVFGEGAAATGG